MLWQLQRTLASTATGVGWQAPEVGNPAVIREEEIIANEAKRGPLFARGRRLVSYQQRALNTVVKAHSYRAVALGNDINELSAVSEMHDSARIQVERGIGGEQPPATEQRDHRVGMRQGCLGAS